MGTYIITDYESGRAVQLVVEPSGDAWHALVVAANGETTELNRSIGDYHNVSRQGFAVAQAMLDQSGLLEVNHGAH